MLSEGPPRKLSDQLKGSYQTAKQNQLCFNQTEQPTCEITNSCYRKKSFHHFKHTRQRTLTGGHFSTDGDAPDVGMLGPLKVLQV